MIFFSDEFIEVCLEICHVIWENNKSKIKATHYASYMPPCVSIPDPQIASRMPRDIVSPDQWRQLVEYWGVPDVVV